MIHFAGSVWRILFADQAGEPRAPARAPEGRFHHNGQFAIYTSLSPLGAGVAICGYVRDQDPPRVIVKMQVAANVVDLRALPDPRAASVVWQTDRANGRPAPTWALSDTARRQGAQGVLYPSRSRLDLTHLTLFDPVAIRETGAPRHWQPDN